MNPPPTSDPWISRSIGDGTPATGYRQRYRLEKRIGTGGMGDVFLAMDTLLGQHVALKLLKDKLATAEDLRKRFEREVALCAALKSDHIVQVTDYGVSAEGHPFYVMEYLRGQTLGQLLRREKRLSIERTVGIISQGCDGLQLAHQGVTLWRDGATASEHIQVVHRDLKPDNIFLVPTALGELVKILDFGIAKICNDTEYTNLTNTFLGTFRYAAPEQLQVEQDLDGRADIYSLGIILYEMLSGSDPFGFGVKAHSTSGVLWGMAHTAKLPQPLRTQPNCEHIPVELEAVVMRCLEKEPDERFQSVDELNWALQDASGLGSTATHYAPTLSSQEFDFTIPRSPSATVQGDDKTIPRSPTPTGQNITDAISDQIPSPPNQKTPEATIPENISPLEHNLPGPTRLLLAMAAGIAISLAVMGAIYAYIHSQPRNSRLDEPQQTSTPTAPTTTIPSDACDVPNSLFCSNDQEGRKE